MTPSDTWTLKQAHCIEIDLKIHLIANVNGFIVRSGDFVVH